MLSFILTMIWFIGGLATIIKFRLLDPFHYIENYDIWFCVNAIVGLIFGLMSWIGLLLLFLYEV